MEKLSPYLSDEHILEIAEKAISGRTVEAVNLLRYYLIGKIELGLEESISIVRTLAKEFS